MTTQSSSPLVFTPKVNSAIKPRRKGLARLRTPQTLRRVIQFGFLAFIAFIALHPAGRRGGRGYHRFLGGLLPDGRPGDALQVRHARRQLRLAHAPVATSSCWSRRLLTALLTRNAFCGWVCPLGFIQDMTSSFSAFVQKRVARRQAVKALKTRWRLAGRHRQALRLLKYAVLVWAVTGAAIYGVMVFRDYDPWAALWNLTELSLGLGTVVLGVTLVASLFVERPWCRYACPLGAATGLVEQAQPGLPQARAERLQVLRHLHQVLPDGPGRAHARHDQEPGLHRLPGVCGGLPPPGRPGTEARPAGHRQVE